MIECTICNDVVDKLTFSCSTTRCTYGLCYDCLQDAFQDPTGANVRNCPFCKKESALPMIESVCGKGAIREVERGLRSRVEHEVKIEQARRHESKKTLDQYKDRAEELFLEVAEELTMKCPRCKKAFHDYDGCNALRCSDKVGCNAAFCAVCLKDCGNDAHPCARTHGDLYDKGLFEYARKLREEGVAAKILSEHVNEPSEVKELLIMKCEKLNGKQRIQIRQDSRVFIARCKKDLERTIKADRLSLLNIDNIDRRLSVNDISPRNVIPKDYQLLLRNTDGSKVSINLFQLDTNNSWKAIPVPDEKSTSNSNTESSVVVDAIVNLKQNLQTCVVAFDGATCLYQIVKAPSDTGERCVENEICVQFYKVSRDGSMHGDPIHPQNMQFQKVVGLNGNKRILRLKQVIDSTGEEELMSEPLRAFVGSSSVKRLFDISEIHQLPPPTFNELNKEQQAVANPITLKNAMECAGPPGTGKTKTITELIRSILCCTDLEIVVLSERNGAIDAIAEKMAHDCFDKQATGKSNVIKDLDLWEDILAFGSAGMGSFGTMFKLEEKLKIHPEILECRRILDEKIYVLNKHKKDMLIMLATNIENTKSLPPNANQNRQAVLIKRGHEADFGTPYHVIDLVRMAADALTKLLVIRNLVLEDVLSIIENHHQLLQFLIPIDKDTNNWSLVVPGIKRGLESIRKELCYLLESDMFDVEKAEELSTAVKLCQATLTSTEGRVTEELLNARVRMATIGSSHKLQPDEDSERKKGKNSIEELNDRLFKLDLSRSMCKDAIIIIDEAGCIPAYEFLGFFCLRRNIRSIVCVGDAHQLPPYAPNSRNNDNRRGNYQQRVDNDKISSMLDVSALAESDGTKVSLTTQYRVPIDIASILNARIYNGKYKTSENAKVPVQGFKFVHTPVQMKQVRNSSFIEKKYVNRSEVDQCIDILQDLRRSSTRDTIMILTPYKNQQREIEFQLRRKGIDNQNVLSIDQCQGQEADYVIISLVQKPTRFLDKNRINVALSRVKKRLYLIADRNEFQQASIDTKWESNWIAKDLLRLSNNNNDFDNDKYTDNFRINVRTSIYGNFVDNDDW